jgi:Cu-Zn family superoxide dismutase
MLLSITLNQINKGEYSMNMSRHIKYFLAVTCFATAANAFADTTVPMSFIAANGVGEPAGTVVISETPYGLLFTPNLHDLTAGGRGFHVHVNPDCDKNGMAAGGHFDPKNTGKHLGPYNDNGHLGDLPVITINADGTATTPVLAPRLHHVAEIKNHALMIHHDGDNYSDAPAPLGGGGARMVCGIIK